MMDYLKADDALLANADEKLCDQSYDVEPFGRCAGHSDLLWVLEAAGDVCINRQALLATDSAMDRSKVGVDLVLNVDEKLYASSLDSKPFDRRVEHSDLCLVLQDEKDVCTNK